MTLTLGGAAWGHGRAVRHRNSTSPREAEAGRTQAGARQLLQDSLAAGCVPGKVGPRPRRRPCRLGRRMCHGRPAGTGSGSPAPTTGPAWVLNNSLLVLCLTTPPTLCFQLFPLKSLLLCFSYVTEKTAAGHLRYTSVAPLFFHQKNNK